MAAPRPHGPHHAPVPEAGPRRVRMEAWWRIRAHRLTLWRGAAPTTQRPDRDPGHLQIRARRLPVNARLRLDPPQRPSKTPKCQYLLALCSTQDVCHDGGRPCLPRRVNVPNANALWPVLRTPPMAGFGCPPRMVSSAGAVVVAGAAAVVAGVAEVVAGAAVVGAATAVVPGWAASSLSLSPHAAANITRAKAIPGNLTYDEGTGRSAFLWVAPASQIIRTERFEDGTKHVSVRATNLVLAQLAAWIVNGAAAVAASRRGGSQARSEALHPSRRGH